MHARSALMIVSCLLITACSRTPQEAVDTYTDAFNRHAIAEQLATASDDITITLEGTWELHGKAEMQGLALYDSLLAGRLVIREMMGDGNLVRCLAVETSDLLTIAGIDSVTEILCFEIKAGKIVQIHQVMTGPSQTRLDAARKELEMWAMQHQPERWKEITPGSFTPQTASNLIQLWELYRAAE